jgi:hypothetical protein
MAEICGGIENAPLTEDNFENVKRLESCLRETSDALQVFQASRRRS